MVLAIQIIERQYGTILDGVKWGLKENLAQVGWGIAGGGAKQPVERVNSKFHPRTKAVVFDFSRN